MYVLAGFGTLKRRVGRVKNFTGMPNPANTFLPTLRIGTGIRENNLPMWGKF